MLHSTTVTAVGAAIVTRFRVPFRCNHLYFIANSECVRTAHCRVGRSSRPRIADTLAVAASIVVLVIGVQRADRSERQRRLVGFGRGRHGRASD